MRERGGGGGLLRTYEVCNSPSISEPSGRAVEECRAVGRKVGLGSAVWVVVIVTRVENRVSEYENRGNIVSKCRN